MIGLGPPANLITIAEKCPKGEAVVCLGPGRELLVGL